MNSHHLFSSVVNDQVCRFRFQLISVSRVAGLGLWLCLAWWFRLDRVFIIISVLLGIYFNLGTRQPGSYSAYNIFNKGFMHLLGDLRGDQIDAELRNKMVGRQIDDAEPPVGGVETQEVRDGNKLCACGSRKKTKKCCGAVSLEEKATRSRLRQAEIERQGKFDKYQFL